ncbi:cell envelope integrity protein CreD [Pleionea sp. CnH1-48]|uniref:cell envelope integrity protein CreD n=1 Tax=Pleionea sp. CnH1-48 TaxID=2954494 RepID=UPI00209867BC|nr:cell envelope integrity protein CreD [Pleionea sp. CnH1-48]
MSKISFIKAGALLAIFILLSILLSSIESTIYERSGYQEEARQSIAESWTHEQSILLPILVIPHKIISQKKSWDNKLEKYTLQKVVEHKLHYEAFDMLDVTTELVSETQQRGIFNVPVYMADINISGKINSQFIKDAKNSERVQIKKPFIAIAVTDKRGFSDIPKIVINEREKNFLPGSQLAHSPFGLHVFLDNPNSDSFSIDASFKLKGMSKIAWIPSAKHTQLAVKSNWPHPSFVGRFLPQTRSIDASGYEASWETGEYSSAISDALTSCLGGHCEYLNNLELAVRQINPIDSYVQSERAIKYSLLVIVMTFVVFILFELMYQIHIHAVQYLLVGFALSLFYLLLIAISEQANFFMAYVISSIACISLIAFYMKAKLCNKQLSSLIAMLAGLDSTLYLIIQSEDYAFLSGTMLLFFALASVMIFTRNIDWSKTLTRQAAK